MKLQIESTMAMTDIYGTPARLWEGMTSNGIPCRVYVCGVVIEGDQDLPEFADLRRVSNSPERTELEPA